MSTDANVGRVQFGGFLRRIVDDTSDAAGSFGVFIEEGLFQIQTQGEEVKQLAAQFNDFTEVCFACDSDLRVAGGPIVEIGIGGPLILGGRKRDIWSTEIDGFMGI